MFRFQVLLYPLFFLGSIASYSQVCNQLEEPLILYYDDFGRVDSTDITGGTYYVWDYSDFLNPVEVQKKTTTPFRWELVPQPYPDLNSVALFQSNGPLLSGEYTVASMITGYYPAKINGVTYVGAALQWAADITGPITLLNEPRGVDHSGNPFGAALLINNPPNTGGEVLYRRIITGIGAYEKIFFETWITVFTNSATDNYNPVNVSLRVEDSQDPSNVVTVTRSATREADGGKGWVKLDSSITLTDVNSDLIFEIINNVNTDQNGNDLVIDDIKISTCGTITSLVPDKNGVNKAKTVFPNPSNNSFSIETEKPVSLRVYSITGLLIETKTISSGEFFGEDLDTGTYFIQVKNGDKVDTLKIIKY